MKAKGWPRLWLIALVFGLGGASTATCADDMRALSSGQSLYLPIYSHMLYGNLGKRGQASSILLSALVSIHNTSRADKACPQLAGPADRNTDGLRRLLQRQTEFQRQHDGLRLSQFLDRLGLCHSDFGNLK